MKNLLKNTFQLLFSISLLTSISCSSDEDDGPSYDFVNQNAQGTIDGISFNFGEGTAEESLIDASELSIKLYDNSEDFTDVCDFLGFGDFVSVFFSIPNAVGIYELNFNLDGSEDARTVTLFNPAETLNIIATEGAVEILSISDTEVTGRLDVRALEGNAVNGNFTVVICQE